MYGSSWGKFMNKFCFDTIYNVNFTTLFRKELQELQRFN